MFDSLDPKTKKILTKALREARERIQVSDPELAEARRRRRLLAACLRGEFGTGARTYVNGSVAHGDALTPLTDIDLGVVVPDPDGAFGPNAKGPEELQQGAADAIRRDLKGEFPNLRVIVGGRKRSVYVSFGAPVDPDGDDFSADVIVALDHPVRGLWIPNYESWDRSDPEAHTELVGEANRVSKYNYARTVRLLKHWSRRHSKPLCSWNIKALGLACLDRELDQLEGMVAWFDHAITDLSWQNTPDPAGVAGPIGLPGDRMELVHKLKNAREKLLEAIDYEQKGYDVLALDALATFFNDPQMLPHPEAKAVASQQLQRTQDMRSNRAGAVTPTVATTVTTTTAATPTTPKAQVRHHTPVRSWAP